MMHQLAIAAAACFLALNLTAAPGLTQEAAPSAADAMLVVGGDVAQPLTLKPADLKSMPRTKVTVSEAGKDTPYEGVLVGELLKRAGAPVGRDLSGKAVATYVRATAKDGYQVVFSLAELDPGSPRTTSSSPTRSTASRCSTIRVRCGLSRRTTSRGAIDSHAAADRGRPPRQVAMSTGKSLCVVFVWLASLVLAGAPSDPSTPYSWNLPKNPHNARAMLGLRSTMCSRSG